MKKDKLHIPFFQRGDIGGVAYLVTNNIVNYLIVIATLTGVMGWPNEIVFGRVVPGIFFFLLSLNNCILRRHNRLGFSILCVGLQLRELVVDRGFCGLELLELGVCGSLLRCKLCRADAAVLVIDCQRLVIRLFCLPQIVVFLRRRVARFDQTLIIILLQRFQISLGLLQFIRVLRFEHEHRVAHVDLLAGLDQDAGDLAGLLDGDVIDLAGLDGAAAADAGVDGAGGGLLRRDLGQGGIHDRLGEEGQHQQDRQKNDGRGLDPFAFSYTVFHVSFLILSQSQNVRCLPPDTPRRAETAADRGSYR